jgi:hypothetical protein
MKAIIVYYSKIEINNLLVTLELILSTFWNTYITFIVEGKIKDVRSPFDIIDLYVYRLHC